MLTSDQIARAFLVACRAELAALKPGNVHAHAGGHRMEVADFERSAVAAAPHIAAPDASVGARILGAAEATWDAVGCNTNLGIILLCAPLAKAAERISPPPRAEGAASPRRGEGLGVGESPTTALPDSPPSWGEGEPLRASLAAVLATLTVADAANAFRAIALMNPAGLGRADTADVARPVTFTLREAMALAANRDRIARAYVTDYEDVFQFALPALARAQAEAATTRPDLAVTALHMALLARFPDSHIVRKHGGEAAEAVRREAAGLLPDCLPVPGPKALAALLEFDGHLKARGLNPGTTADFVVATLFASLIEAAFAAAGGH